MSTPRYTLDGDDALEARLGAIVRGVAADVEKFPFARDIAAVILGGGYGRGEGGVWAREGHPQAPFNDLDFFVICKTPCQTPAGEINAAFAALGHQWTKQSGVEVDFGAVRPRDYVIRRLDVMMWQEMVRGHRVIFGDKHIFSTLTEADLPSIPLREGARLLMNRMAGLVHARDRMNTGVHTLEDAGFVARNINKALLGVGDVLLVEVGSRAFAADDRLEALKQLPPSSFSRLPELCALYAKAVAFKRRPDVRVDHALLRADWERACALAEAFWREKNDVFSRACRPNLVRLVYNLRACLAVQKDYDSWGIPGPKPARLLPALLDTWVFLLNKKDLTKDDFSRFLRIWGRLN